MMQLPPLKHGIPEKQKFNFQINRVRCTFLGRPLTQQHYSFFIWEKLLSRFDFARIIELGTWKGNLSFYLFLFCLSEEAEFYTYDLKRYSTYFDKTKDTMKQELGFWDHFYQDDIWEVEDQIAELIEEEGRTILFCDARDKLRQFETFSSHLKESDIIGVHDWEREIHPEQIETPLKKLDLIFPKIYNYKNLKSDVRFFIKHEK